MTMPLCDAMLLTLIKGNIVWSSCHCLLNKSAVCYYTEENVYQVLLCALKFECELLYVIELVSSKHVQWIVHNIALYPEKEQVKVYATKYECKCWEYKM